MTLGARPRRVAPRLRRAWSILATLDDDGPRIRNFARSSSAPLTAAALAVLAGAGGWRARRALLRQLREAGDRDPGATLGLLQTQGALVAEGSAEAALDGRLERRWPWGVVAAAFHGALRDPPFLADEAAESVLAQRATSDPPRGVIPRRGPRALPLPPPRRDRGVLPHLLRRESRRVFGRGPLRLCALADVLFAGLGVRGLLHDPVQGCLPLKLAPSGGARNPIDGYLYALEVEGLPRGIYRYAGVGHTLEPVHLEARALPRLLLGGQPWVDGSAAVIFLVASFSRTAWKYRHPIAYRVVLLEAGHIAQNLQVAACDLGLAAAPTCAFSDSVAEAVLRLDRPDQALLHAVVLGPRAAAQRPSRARRAASSRAGP